MAASTITTPTTGTSILIGADPATVAAATSANAGKTFVTTDGFDLVWLQTQLQSQMVAVQNDIQSIEQNANLSDTEKMFSMQMSMNTWSAIASLRTNMLKSVSDTLKSISRNVS